MAVDALVHQLFLLNLLLQVFDGLATYHGVGSWGEGNPIIHETMLSLGIGPALLLFKAKACGYLVLIRRLRAPRVAIGGLAFVAVVYATLSFFPWMMRLGTLLVA
jgi:hypothetical protein